MNKIKHIPRVPIMRITCKGKVPHKTLLDVIAAMDRIAKKHPESKFNWYICQHCGDYHIGRVKCDTS